MATNRKFDSGDVLRVTVPSPTESGDAVVYGDMVGVALTDYSSEDLKATVAFEGVYLLSVSGTNAAGNVAVAEGDALYISSDGATISKNATGVFIGYAMETVDSAATATIQVRLADGGSGNSEALAGLFISGETTATGSEQSIAHGLGRTPTKVLIVLTEFTSVMSVDIAYGTHTGTNVVCTVTPSGAKFKVFAY